MVGGLIAFLLIAFAIYVRSVPPKEAKIDIPQPQSPLESASPEDIQAAVQEALLKQQEAEAAQQQEPKEGATEPETIEL